MPVKAFSGPKKQSGRRPLRQSKQVAWSVRAQQGTKFPDAVMMASIRAGPCCRQPGAWRTATGPPPCFRDGELSPGSRPPGGGRQKMDNGRLQSPISRGWDPGDPRLGREALNETKRRP